MRNEGIKRLGLVSMLRIVVPLLATGLPATAMRTNDSWTTVARKPGTKLVVMGVDGRVHRGRLLEWTPEAVAVQMAAERVHIARGEVAVIRAAGPLGDFHTVYAPWENLSGLALGMKIQVMRSNGIQVNGALAGSTEEGITVARRNENVFVPRGHIRRVRILMKSSAQKGYEVGAAIGFLAGLAMLAAAASQGGSSTDCPGEGLAGGLAVAAFAGGKTGQALAGLFDRYQTVYVSPRQ